MSGRHAILLVGQLQRMDQINFELSCCWRAHLLHKVITTAG
jgi:hypothetical protein